MVTVQKALHALRDRFREAGLDTPELDARLLAQAALGLKAEDLLMKADETISDAQQKTLNQMAQRRLMREPVSRILGTRAFWKSEFKVSPATLDPRPDSETLVEAVLKHVNKNDAVKILDLGTGTGCLLLSLLLELPNAQGTGIDISAEAIETARHNAEALSFSNRCLFMANTWDQFKPADFFDIVISNPPYIPQQEIAQLAPEVRRYDPLQALSGGPDGLDCYRQIGVLLPKMVAPGGMVFFEIGAGQAESVREILAGCGVPVLQILQDLAGHDRCVVASIGSDVSVKEKRAPKT